MKNLLLFFTLTLSINCFSQSHTWTGNGPDDLWSNPENWDALTVPDATSTILIDGSGDIVLAQGANDGATIVIEQGAKLIVAGTLNIHNNTTINQAEIEILTGGLYSNPSGTITIQNGAKLMVEGSLDMNNSQTNIVGANSEIHFFADASLNNNGATIVIEQGAKLIVESDISNSGIIDNSGTIEVMGDFVNAENLTSNGMGSEIIVFPDSSLQNNGGTITIQNNTKLVVQGVLLNPTGSIVNNGTIEVEGDFTNAATITTNGIGNDIILFPDSSLQNNGGTITIQNNAKLVVQGELLNTTGSIVNSGTIEVEGDFTNAATVTSDGGGAEIIVLDDGLISNNGGTITIQNNAKLVV